MTNTVLLDHLGWVTQVWVGKSVADLSHVQQPGHLKEAPNGVVVGWRWVNNKWVLGQRVTTQEQVQVPQPPVIKTIERVSEVIVDEMDAVADHELARQYGISEDDPLWKLKIALVRTIADTVNRVGPTIPEDIRNEWTDYLAQIAAVATAATSAEGIAEQRELVVKVLEAA